MIKYVKETGQPYRFDADVRARLEAMTDEDIHAGALADPDNPPLDSTRLERMQRPVNVRDARERLGLSQAEFAQRFHFSLGRLRDLEQGRTRPDGVVTAYLRLIEADPGFVARILAA